MNLKKLIPISDHILFFTFSKKKVFSRFNVGIVLFFIFLCVVFFNVSFKNPISNNFVFQGFNFKDNNNNKSSVISWSLSFTRTSARNSSDSGKLGDLGDAHFGNFTKDVKNGSFIERKGDFEGAHFGNFTNGMKNDVLDLKGSLVNLSNDVKNGSLNGNSEIHFSNFTNGVKNGSFDYVLDLKGSLVNLTKNVKNGSLNGISETHFGNFTKDVKNGSFDDVVDLKGNLRNLTNDVKNGSFGAVTDEPLDGKVLIGAKDANASVSSTGINTDLDLKNNAKHSSYKECDIFNGRWVRDDSKPFYKASSCPYVDRDFDCHLNKRPDDEYVKWKWQPYGCEIPSLNATDFLERLRGKKLVFVGDSLNRNMWESLVCILRDSVPHKNRVYEISGRHEFKKKGFYAFRFEDYNCTVDFVSSPFLVRESSVNGKNGSIETLRLDLMDRSTSMYHDADVLVFNTGHWWTHEKTSRGEDYYQEGTHVYPRLKVLDAYRRALNTWARWVDKNIDINKTQVIFRGYSVTHFKGGQWNSGGQCHKETKPIFNMSHLTKYPSKMRAFDNVLQEMKTPIVYLNISRLTDYRKDGHPSIYRRQYSSVQEQIAAEQSQDCSHWCLPGVPDTWNELLYASLLKVGRGPWKI